MSKLGRFMRTWVRMWAGVEDGNAARAPDSSRAQRQGIGWWLLGWGLTAVAFGFGAWLVLVADADSHKRQGPPSVHVSSIPTVEAGAVLACNGWAALAPDVRFDHLGELLNRFTPVYDDARTSGNAAIERTASRVLRDLMQADRSDLGRAAAALTWACARRA